MGASTVGDYGIDVQSARMKEVFEVEGSLRAEGSQDDEAMYDGLVAALGAVVLQMNVSTTVY